MMAMIELGEAIALGAISQSHSRAITIIICKYLNLMELAFINLLDLLTVAPNLVPEVFHQPSVRNPIAVSLGAIAGALSRYYLSLWLAKTFGTGFPYATVFVNLTGSFLMGLVTTLILERTLLISPEVRLLIAVGFLNRRVRANVPKGLCTPSECCVAHGGKPRRVLSGKFPTQKPPSQDRAASLLWFVHYFFYLRTRCDESLPRI